MPISRTFLKRCSAGLVLAFLAACGSVPPPVVPTSGPPFQQAVERLTDDVLSRAVQQRAVNTGRAQPLTVVLPVDGTRQHPAADAERIARWAADRVNRQHPAFVPATIRSREETPDRWLLRTVVTAPEDSARPASASGIVHQLTVELVDTAGRTVLTSARTAVTDPALDKAFAARHVPPRLESLPPTAAGPAPVTPAQLQAWSDEYMALLRRGRDAEAQAVFGRIVAAGLSSRQLAMKLLFAPGSTDFWRDPALTRQYSLWISEIARQVNGSPHCVQVVGHSSRKGGEAYNRKLSVQRAEAVRQLLVAEQPAIAGKLVAVGLGYSQTVVGSGSDDRRDAADRRVEFRVVDCL